MLKKLVYQSQVRSSTARKLTFGVNMSAIMSFSNQIISFEEGKFKTEN